MPDVQRVAAIEQLHVAMSYSSLPCILLFFSFKDTILTYVPTMTLQKSLIYILSCSKNTILGTYLPYLWRLDFFRLGRFPLIMFLLRPDTFK